MLLNLRIATCMHAAFGAAKPKCRATCVVQFFKGSTYTAFSVTVLIIVLGGMHLAFGCTLIM